MSEDVVLLVEDHAATGEVVRLLLEEELGVTTVVARDGKEALRQLREIRPALVILDVVLPDVDGVVIAKQLKADPATDAIPLIAVTGMRKACEEAIEAGCLACLDKPFNLDQLTSLVQQYLTPKERSVSESAPAAS